VTQAALARVLGVAETTISSYETGQASPGDDNLRTYATFFSTPRSWSNGQAAHLLQEEDLSPEEDTARERLLTELKRLRDLRDPASQDRRRTWQFPDDIPVRLVCGRIPDEQASPLASPRHPNHTRLLSFADADAMVELFGHIRAENPTLDVRYVQPDDLSDADLSGHVVVMGGLGWNQTTEAFLDQLEDLPVHQVEDGEFPDGEIFVVDTRDGPRRHVPQRSKNAALGFTEDIGFFARFPNPYNSESTLTFCNGVHSRGVLGAVRMLTHPALRDSNEKYLANRFRDATSYCMLLRVPINSFRIVTPELNNPRIRLFEWPDPQAAEPRRP
jgi:transcriptional regulator with XRE-family HTH domain